MFLYFNYNFIPVEISGLLSFEKWIDLKRSQSSKTNKIIKTNEIYFQVLLLHVPTLLDITRSFLNICITNTHIIKSTSVLFVPQNILIYLDCNIITPVSILIFKLVILYRYTRIIIFKMLAQMNLRYIWKYKKAQLIRKWYDFSISLFMHLINSERSLPSSISYIEVNYCPVLILYIDIILSYCYDCQVIVRI